MVDAAYAKVGTMGNPRIDATPYAQRIREMIKDHIELPKAEQDKALLKTLREDLKTIVDNDGTLTLRELRARMQHFGTKGYQSDTTKAGYYRTLRGGVDDAMEVAEKTGKGIAPEALEAYRAARTLHKRKLGGDELKDILQSVSKEKDGMKVLKRDSMIDKIEANEQLAKSFPEAERADIIETLRKIELPKPSKFSVNPATELIAGTLVGEAVGGLASAAGFHRSGLGVGGATAATALLLSTSAGRSFLRHAAKKANGPLPSNVLISGAAALAGGSLKTE